MIEFLLRIIISVLLAALESAGSVDPAPPAQDSAANQPSTEVPIASGSEHAAAMFGLLRAVDPCALHDITAATRITGDHPDQIMPDTSLATCHLRLNRRPLEPTWTFSTHVGVGYPAAQRQAATLEEIDGRRTYRDESRDPHDRTCTYTRPIGTEFGISLTVHAPLNRPSAQPCPIAKAYLLAARPLTHLVLRMEKRTEPRLTLASIDPCAPTRAVLHQLGSAGTAQPQTPYECRIQPDTTLPEPRTKTPVTISFHLAADPTNQTSTETGHPSVLVAGHPAVATADPSTGLCQLALVYDNNVAVAVEHTRYIQTIDIRATSCEAAKVVAATVLDTIANR